jgi:hypothetical protein
VPDGTVAEVRLPGAHESVEVGPGVHAFTSP